MPTDKVINGILLSSGFSRRMGSFKPLLEYNGQPFCIEIIRKLLPVCNSIVIVTGFNLTVLIDKLESENVFSGGKVFSCYNPDYEYGMFTSLQAGLRYLTGRFNPPVSPLLTKGGTEVNQDDILTKGGTDANADSILTKGQPNCEEAKLCVSTEWVIVHMVDQPDLPEEFYKEFAQSIEDEFDWIQPEFKGRKGHPIAMKSTLFRTIISAPKDSTLRTLFLEDDIQRKILDYKYPQVLSDIDTPEDYKILINRPE